MERGQLWRRVWLRLQRKSHSRTYTMASRTHSAPERSDPPPARYTLSRRPYSFFSLSIAATGVSLRPKCLLDVDCTNLLMGGTHQYEDFSSTCWLENHLHRFGTPSSLPQSNMTNNNPECSSFPDPTTSSSAGETSDDVHSLDSADSVGSGSGAGSVEFHNQMNSDNGSIINLHRYPYIDSDFGVTEPLQPPPYADEPPPSYEEAVAGSSLFDNDTDNTDFLW